MSHINTNFLGNKATKWFDLLEWVFKIEFLFYMFFSYNNLFFGKKIMSVFVILSTLLGSALFLSRLINWKAYIKTKYLWLLIGFCISYVITMILNVKYGFLPGLKTLVWTGFMLLIIYPYRPSAGIDKYKKEFKIISYIYIFYMFIASIWSLIQFFIGFSSIPYKDETGYVIPAGVMWGRLWGVFTDPNQGAVFACIALVLSLYFILSASKNAKKEKHIFIFNIVNIVVQTLYITFSDSRTGLVCLAVGLAFFAYTYFIKKVKISKNILRYATSLLLSGVVFIFAFFTPIALKNANNFIQIEIYKSLNPTQEDKENPTGIIGREDDISTDISNRRFSIWKSSLEIFSTKPICGVSHTNLVSYAQKELPQTYLINNSQYPFTTTHNMLVDVLTSQGIIGIVVLLSFMLSCIVFIFKRIGKLHKENYLYSIVLLSCVAMSFVSSLFITEIIYVYSQIGFIFWLFLGYLMHLLSKTEDETSNNLSEPKQLDKITG